MYRVDLNNIKTARIALRIAFVVIVFSRFSPQRPLPVCEIQKNACQKMKRLQRKTDHRKLVSGLFLLLKVINTMYEKVNYGELDFNNSEQMIRKILQLDDDRFIVSLNLVFRIISVYLYLISHYQKYKPLI